MRTTHPQALERLGNVTGKGLIQVAGTIGDDPTDPLPFNAADVDLYHFMISGPGRCAFQAEVFAGRIGSPLPAAFSLFRLSPEDGQLQLVASGNSSMNDTTATDAGRPDFSDQPLLADPALFMGLEAGDYYLAVSSSPNVPDPIYNPPGTNGVYDPMVSHSGTFGLFTGPYVLNLEVDADVGPPAHVTATSPAEGAVLTALPTQVTVQFDKPLNVKQAEFLAWSQGVLPSQDPIYISGTTALPTDCVSERMIRPRGSGRF